MNKKEYIERGALLRKIRYICKTYGVPKITTERFEKAIKNRIEADVVAVVRCKDCKYYKQNPYCDDEDMMCQCWCDWLPTDPDDFCSFGERRE